ncbi:MAG: hypothetical protein V3R93_01180, partial [Candidatus Hydrothermarchaeaceae archaeon]
FWLRELKASEMAEVINPFSKKAKRIVKSAPPIHELPDSIFELAKEKVIWKKNERRPPKGILDIGSEEDVLSYHVLFLSAGLNFSAYSNEVRLVRDITYEITKGRLTEARRIEGDNFRWRFDNKFDVLDVPTEDVRNQEYEVSWKSFLPLVRSKELRLTDWDIADGYVRSNRVRMRKHHKLNLDDLIDMYSHLIAVEAVDHMSALFKREDRLSGVPGSLKGVADTLSEVSTESYKYKTAFAGGKSRKFSQDNFPSCIQSILRGVSSGSRNYAICVLLTSFLSYARAAPGKVDDPRLSDFIKDQKVLDNEIMPLIYEGAQRCQPPLFEDQPLEKMNVSYHLGLGLTEDVKLENSGSSKWYVPPNCEKVRRESPGLCKPDDLCQKIKNPLNYYFIKMKDAKEGEEKEETEGKPPMAEKP